MQRIVFSLVILAFLLSCTDVGNGLEPLGINEGNTRRVYVNDLSSNKKLQSFISETGIQFVAQPQGKYSLFIGNVPEESMLHIRFASQTSLIPSFSPLSGKDTILDGVEGKMYYMNQLDLGKREVVLLALRRTKQRVLEDADITKVMLFGEGNQVNNKLGIHFLYYGTYDRFIPEYLDDSLVQWTSFLYDSLNTVFKSWGITLDTVSSSRLGVSSPATVTLPEVFYNSITGVSTPFNPVDITKANSPKNYLQIVFVNKMQRNTSSQTLDTLPVLGYSVQAGDMFGVTGPYVVVSLDSTININQVSIPLVVAHEIGHFLGLRHSVTTESEQGIDGDLSNIEDGIPDNDCGSSMGNNTIPLWLHGNPQGLPDCTVAQRNLMYPSYRDKNQNQLTSQQINQMKKYLSLIPH